MSVPETLLFVQYVYIGGAMVLAAMVSEEGSCGREFLGCSRENKANGLAKRPSCLENEVGYRETRVVAEPSDLVTEKPSRWPGQATWLPRNQVGDRENRVVAGPSDLVTEKPSR